MWREKLDTHDARVVHLGSRRPGGDPFREDPVIERVSLEAFAALVRDGAGGLEEHQTAPGIAGHDAPAKSAAGEGQEIAFVIVAAKGKLEAILPGGGAVTGPRAATVLGQDGLNMIAKAPIERFVQPFDRDARAGGLFAGFGRNRRGAIVHWQRRAVLDSHNGGIAGDKLHFVGHMADELAVTNRFEEELLTRRLAVENDVGRKNGKLLRCPCRTRQQCQAK